MAKPKDGLPTGELVVVDFKRALVNVMNIQGRPQHNHCKIVIASWQHS